MNKRQIFLQHVAQTSCLPTMLDVASAEGLFIFDSTGKKFMDLNSGICVSSLGHRHPQVVNAIKSQVDQYLHTMVYGEHLQSPQIEYAHLLSKCLPKTLNSIYFLMAGTEATEGAMKLAKRYTGRPHIVSCRNAYHGSTQGAESLRSDENYKRAFYPLLPGISHIVFNRNSDLNKITSDTACVITEPVQAEAGVIVPQNDYLAILRSRCNETGTLLVLDEIQTGFGRTGSLFAFQKYGVVPDILLLGKAMGGGMPLSAFVSSKEIMSSLIKNPALGHITTFGGHPVSCASAKATLEVLLNDQLIEKVERKASQFLKSLHHQIVKEVRNTGLMMAVELTRRKYLKHVINYCFQNGLIIDYFLFNNRSFRLAPPLIITESQISRACEIMKASFDYAQSQY